MSAEAPPERPILEEDLHAYVDGCLESARRREVQDYLDRHPEAAQQLDAFSMQRAALRDALAGIAEEPLPARLNLARLMAERRSPRHVRWRIAAAVLLAFGLGISGGWFMRGTAREGSGAGIAALAREATSSFAVYAADPTRPVEIGADRRKELVSWISDRIQRPVAVPDLTAAGYRFIGGRLVATDHGAAGMFIYEDAGGTRLAMLVRPMAIEGNTPTMKESRGGRLTGYTWAQDGLGYSVVGTDPPQTLHPLANELRRQTAAPA